MSGPPPKEQRRRRNEPARGDWQRDPRIGWQHGEVPAPPARLSAPAREAWQTWMASWFAAHWMPADLPGLALLIRLYARVSTGNVVAAERAELRHLMDNYGITPKGQQERRWAPPKAEDIAPAASTSDTPYVHLRVVNE